MYKLRNQNFKLAELGWVGQVNKIPLSLDCDVFFFSYQINGVTYRSEDYYSEEDAISDRNKIVESYEKEFGA